MPPAADPLHQLFHQEFARLVAVLSRRFGLQHLETAEDLVADTFALAADAWARRGVPENPAAWLHVVARQQALHWLRRQRVYAQRVQPALAAEANPAESPEPDFDFSAAHSQDSQLQMLFAVCTPQLASEAQIALALRVLCGFGIGEIAEAFGTSKETVNKRLVRARDKLRRSGLALAPPPAPDLVPRLNNVLRVVYLLFREGYYATSDNQVLRQDLCAEALRLGLLLTDYAATDLPKTNALVALMCFHASRFRARAAAPGVLYDAQDEALWDQPLIARGGYYLIRAAQGPELSTYHLEARIAYWHCQKADTPEKWAAVLALYDQLLQLQYSSGAALNRTYALYKVHGPQVALAEARRLPLDHQHFYHLLLGELQRTLDPPAARAAFRTAHDLARSSWEKESIRARLEALG